MLTEVADAIDVPIGGPVVDAGADVGVGDVARER